MNILFVCKHNRFRSKIAEAVFKKFNRNKKIKAASAGIFKGIPVNKKVIAVGKKFGLKINKKTQGIKEKWFRELGLLIIIADDIPKIIFKNKVRKIIVWKIPDCSCSDKECIEKTSERIIAKVKNLVKQLEKAK